MSRPKSAKKLKTDPSEGGGGGCSASALGQTSRVPTCIIHCVDNPSDKITLLSDSGDGPGRLKKLQDVCALRLSQPAGTVHRMPDVCSQVPTSYSEDCLYGYHRACYQRFTGNLSRLKTSDEPPEAGCSTS